MFFIEWMLILLGHVAIACVMFNHVHAYASPHSGKFSEKAILIFAILPLPLFVYIICVGKLTLGPSFNLAVGSYMLLAKIVSCYFIVRWIYRASTARLPKNVKLVSATVHDFRENGNEPLLSGAKAKLLGAIPGNQLLKVRQEHWDFHFSQLPDDLVGAKICQLSDLHFTGLIGKKYFERVFELIEQAQPDLIVITGDLLDEDICLDWIEGLLGKLTAKHGVFYIFGNHDLLVTDQKDYRKRLADAGLQPAADGQWHEIRIGNACLMLAGNEHPWYVGRERLSAVIASQAEKTNAFRMLLAHSPDQIGWAVSRGFDLVFAGHTHGGQIRLPVVGPIIAPSRYGIKYASGTFRFRDTLMHVSRGLSGDEPIRINCLPEIGFFTLKKSGT